MQIAYLIEENRPAVGQLELAPPRRRGAAPVQNIQ
jgi:hypothetical protein